LSLSAPTRAKNVRGGALMMDAAACEGAATGRDARDARRETETRDGDARRFDRSGEIDSLKVARCARCAEC
jgi:hypothetical protein